MIGAHITLVRVKPERHPVTGRPGERTFTVKGVIIDSVDDDNGDTMGVRIRGTRDSEPVDSWYVVGPHALDGSLCTEQTATLDACGHAVTDGCDCA
jgi:hypothetical protein